MGGRNITELFANISYNLFSIFFKGCDKFGLPSECIYAMMFARIVTIFHFVWSSNILSRSAYFKVYEHILLARTYQLYLTLNDFNSLSIEYMCTCGMFEEFLEILISLAANVDDQK